MRRPATFHARHVCLLLACLLLLAFFAPSYTTHDAAHSAFGGLVRVAYATEVATEASPTAAAAAAVVEEGADGEPDTPADTVEEETLTFDGRGDFDDESAAEAAAAAAVAVESATAVPPDELLPLDSFTDDELKTLLSDMKKGNVNFKHYANREELVAAIREMETKALAQKKFRAEVERAGRWYAETQEEHKYQQAAARRAKASRVKHDGDVPAALRAQDGATEGRTHELRFVYNEANGYAKTFLDIMKDLESAEGSRLPNFDALRVFGEPYPIERKKMLMSHAMQICFYGVMMLGVMPDMIPIIPLAVRNFMRNRRSLVISTAFMINMMSRSLTQNRAFEVYLDGELIYSALKMGGRLPTSEVVSTLVLERTLLREYAAAMAAKVAAAVL